MRTLAFRPSTRIPPASPATSTTSAPFVAFTVTRSAWPSPPPPLAARSSRTCVASVPFRSPTTTLSAPPRARNSIVSTLSRSVVTLSTFRRKSTRAPLATTSIASASSLPWKSSLSVPPWPSIVSRPSPGAQENSSLPGPPTSTSAPGPPAILAPGSVPPSGSRTSWSSPARPWSTMRTVLATVGTPPLIGTFPPFTTIEPLGFALTT